MVVLLACSLSSFSTVHSPLFSRIVLRLNSRKEGTGRQRKTGGTRMFGWGWGGEIASQGCRHTANLNKIALTEQSSKMSFGLNLFEDSACISTPLLALILMDLENSFFSSPQPTESLQLYLILCLARSLSKRRNSNWLASATYSICKARSMHVMT